MPENNPYSSWSREDLEAKHNLLLQINPQYRRLAESTPGLNVSLSGKQRTLGNMAEDNAVPPERTLANIATDAGVSLARGGVQAVDAMIGLANLPTGGHAGKFIEDVTGYEPGELDERLASHYSPAQQAANRKVSEAKGFLSTLGTAIQNPSTIVHSVLESTPSMVAGGFLGRGLLAAGGRIAPKAMQAAGQSRYLIAGAAGEGSVQAGSMAEEVRQQNEDGLLTGKQIAQSVGSGIGTGAFGIAGARLAKKLGIGDIDTWLAGGKLSPGAKTGKAVNEVAKSSVKNHKGVVGRIISGGITEGIFEELPQSAQEQVWMNAATDKPLGEGVGEAAALGMLAGAAMGGGFGIFSTPDVIQAETAVDKKDGKTKDSKKQPAGKFFSEKDFIDLQQKQDMIKQQRLERKQQLKADLDLAIENNQKQQIQKKLSDADTRILNDQARAEYEAKQKEDEAYWQAEEAKFQNELKVRKYNNILETALKEDFVGTSERYVNNPELLAEFPIEVQENFFILLAAFGNTLSTPNTTEIVSTLLSQNQRLIDSDAYFDDGPFEVVANDFADLSPEEQETIIKREQSALALIKRQREIMNQNQPRKSLREIELEAALDRFANRIENHLPGFIEIAEQQKAEIPILEGPAPDQIIPIDYGEADPRQFDPFAKITQRLGGKIFPRPQDISPEAVEGYDPYMPVPRIGTNYQHLQPLATSIRQRDEMLRNPLTMEIEAANNNVDPATFRQQLIQDNIADRAALNTMFKQANQEIPPTEREALESNQTALIENQNQVRQLTNQLKAVNSKAEQTEINRQILSLLDEQKQLKNALAVVNLKTEEAVVDSEINAEPSDEQKAAGNYKKAKMEIDGLKISIENPAGSTRSGTDPEGNEWSSEMGSHYGYFQRSEGKDGDQVDVFVKPDTVTSPKVFVVDQIDPKTGKFDEHKVILGAENAQEATALYLSNYEDGWQGLGNITELTQTEFKSWLNDSKRTKKPLAKSAKTTPGRSTGEQQVKDATPGVSAQIAANETEIERLMMQTVTMPKGPEKTAIRNQIQRLIVENQKLKDGSNSQFEIREDRTPGQGITLSDVQATYPGQQVFQSEDGSFSVRFKNGRGVTIQKITGVGDGFIEVAMNTGEMSNKDGKILGVTIDNNILLDKDFADNATLWHENKHVLDNMGLITQDDDAALNREFNRLRKAGKLTFALSTNTDPVQAMRENRANTFAQVMLNRAEYRNKPLGTLIQRVLDFFNKLLNLGRQTVGGLAREVETGRIYERKVGDQTYQVTVPQMEQSANTFYSQLRNTIDQKMSKGTGESVKKQVQAWANKGEFKQDELEWSGLMNWLEGKKTVTKKDVLDYLDANQIRIEEVVKEATASNDDKIIAQINYLYQQEEELRQNTGDAMMLSPADRQAELTRISNQRADLERSLEDQTKFSSYQEPGGTNYKEVLLTLPAQGAKTVEEYYTSGGYANDYPGAIDVPWSELNDYQKRLIAEAHAEAGNQDTRGQDYKGPHYDEPNILVHVRMNDRTGPNGEKVLFLEEVQSDWHQEGRKKGYTKNLADEKAAIVNKIKPYFEQNFLNDSETSTVNITANDILGDPLVLEYLKVPQNIIDESLAFAKKERNNSSTVPNAPFKGSKNWAMLAMKKMVRYAAENGYDQIAWTPGEIQVERYKQALRTAVDKIEWNKTQDSIQLVGYKNGQQVVNTIERENSISDAIGKSMGDQIIESPQQSGTFEGDDITVSDTGMAGFYDKILPAEVNKFFNKKSWGSAKVGQTELETQIPDSNAPFIVRDANGNFVTRATTKERAKQLADDVDGTFNQEPITMSAWTLPITPKMRSKALREGFPQFQVAETNISDPNIPTRDIPQEEYDRIHAHKKNIWDKVRQVSRMTKADAKLFLDKIAGPISTRLKNISPLLSAKLRKLDFDTTTQISQQLQVALPIMRAVDKMSSADQSAWDWATKNGDINRINTLAAKYGIKENYNQLRQVLDNIRKAAIDVGYDVGYVDNYWPRILKDTEGFLQVTKEISRRPEFTDALKAKAKKLGISVKNMDKDLKADIIGNIILSNYGGTGGPGNIQGRVFDIIPEEFAPYYMDSGAALMQYIYSMNKKIEARRFFGRVPKNIGRAKTKVRAINTRLVSLQEMEALMTSEGQDTTDIQNKINELQDEIKLHQAVIEKYKINDRDFSENIDTYIVELMEKGIITEDHETTVKEILNARFHEQGTHGIVNKYKNFSYIDTMGSPISALTQIGDLAWAYYVGGLTPTGIARTTKNLIKAVFNESGITKEDLGIERIAQEFADADTMSNAVSWVFKKVGLERIDSIGKETLINTAFENYKAKANNNPEALKKEIRHIFGKDTNSVVQDLLANNPSENVKLLVYNRLLDFQPVALSEMPEKYLNSGNGRIFYMLKTYTLKQIDVFRREVYQQLRSKDPQVVMSGMRNLISLASVLTLANAGADALKDLIMDKESKFEDHVIENLLTLGGASRYLQTQIRKDGAGSALFGQILPPFKFVDSLTRDVFGDVSEGVRSVESIPVVGKLYYWHYGRGSEKKLSLAEQEFNKLKKETNKFKNQFDKAGDKREFLRSNIDQFRQMKMVDSMQGSLNRNKALINKLKDMPQTPNIQKRIAQVKRQRDLMLENFFQRTNMGD